uniref:C2H2-type domain-containing protein n=1 Tax=Clytia hemisphaerica TaxID=252671 RepID=A0A7M5WTX9_9CNID|eukprot:TCONS_00029646-protein
MSFSQLYDLEAHLKDAHGGFKCVSCEKSFMTKSGLITRQKEFHKDRSKCQHCGKVLATEESLKRHSTRHPCHQEKRFSCIKCGKGFTTNSSLALHDNEIHKMIETFKCSIYAVKLIWVIFEKSQYKNHMNSHNNVKPLKCEECGKRFQQKT